MECVWASEGGTITHLPPQWGTEGPPGARIGPSLQEGSSDSEQLLLPSDLLTLSISSAVVAVITGGFSESVPPLFDQILGFQWRKKLTKASDKFLFVGWRGYCISRSLVPESQKPGPHDNRSKNVFISVVLLRSSQ